MKLNRKQKIYLYSGLYILTSLLVIITAYKLSCF